MHCITCQRTLLSTGIGPFFRIRPKFEQVIFFLHVRPQMSGEEGLAERNTRKYVFLSLFIPLFYYPSIPYFLRVFEKLRHAG